MPRLLLFVPAEKVIVDADENTLAVIGVITGINVGIPQGSQPIPENSGAPIRWYVLAVWRREPDDEGRRFQQKVELLSPSRQPLFESIVDFEIPGLSHRNKVQITGFPVGEGGEYTVKLSIRCGDEQWREAADYPLMVSYFNPAQ